MLVVRVGRGFRYWVINLYVFSLSLMILFNKVKRGVRGKAVIKMVVKLNCKIVKGERGKISVINCIIY